MCNTVSQIRLFSTKNASLRLIHGVQAVELLFASMRPWYIWFLWSFECNSSNSSSTTHYLSYLCLTWNYSKHTLNRYTQENQLIHPKNNLTLYVDANCSVSFIVGCSMSYNSMIIYCFCMLYEETDAHPDILLTYSTILVQVFWILQNEHLIPGRHAVAVIWDAARRYKYCRISAWDKLVCANLLQWSLQISALIPCTSYCSFFTQPQPSRSDSQLNSAKKR